MPYPTAEECCDRARAILGDHDVAGGDIYTNDKLLPHIQQAAEDLWLSLTNIQAPAILRIRYFILRANTVSLDIAGAVSSMATLMPDLAEPVALYDRAELTEYTITAAAAVATGVQVTTSAAHGRATGDRLTLGGMVNSDGKAMGGDGYYGITVVDSTQFVALGAYMRIAGTYSSGGVALYSANRFRPMKKVGRLDPGRIGAAALETWAWNEDRLTFPGSDVARQIRCVYRAGVTAPAEMTDIIAVNNSKGFIGTLAAAYATRVRMPGISSALRQEALGRTLQRDGSGGMLRDLILPVNNSSQLDSDKQRQPIEFIESQYIGLSL